MDRKRILAAAVALLAVVNVVWYFYSNWGLVTVHAKAQPLSKIIASIERQGHVTIKTNIDPSTPVSMSVTKVPVTLALEALAVNTSSSWRLSYYVAPQKGDIATAVASFQSGKRPDGWKTFFFPAREQFSGDEATAPPDPRALVWKVKTPKDTTLQSYLDDAALNGGIAISIPENWNPQVRSTPSPGRISKLISKLTSASGGAMQEFFALQRFQRGPRPDGDGPPPDDGARQARMERMGEAMQVQIDNLPPDQRAAAQERLDAERKFWQGLQAMSDEERRAKMQERLNDPAMQDQIQKQQDKQDSLSAPQQKVERSKNYVNRKSAARAQK